MISTLLSTVALLSVIDTPHIVGDLLWRCYHQELSVLSPIVSIKSYRLLSTLSKVSTTAARASITSITFVTRMHGYRRDLLMRLGI